MTRFRFLPVPSGSLFSTLLKYYAGSLGYGGLAQRLQYTYMYICMYIYIYMCMNVYINTYMFMDTWIKKQTKNVREGS